MQLKLHFASSLLCQAGRFILILILIQQLLPLSTQAQSAEYYMVVASPDGEMIAGVDTSPALHIWDAHSGVLLFSAAGIVTPPLSIAWSPDSNRIATAGGDAIIRVWCINNTTSPRCTLGELLAEIIGHESAITALAWSTDNRLASGSQYEARTVRVWDMTDYSFLASHAGGTVTQLAWHPTDDLLAQASDSGGVYLLEGDLSLSARDRIDRLISPNDVIPTFSVAWNSEGTQLAYGTFNGAIHVIDITTDNEVAVFQTTGRIYALAWSPDGSQLASSSDTGAIQVWNVRGDVLQTQATEALEVEKTIAATLQISWTREGALLYPGGGLQIQGLSMASDSAIPIPDLEVPTPEGP
jgi:WD40 repeat protein